MIILPGVARAECDNGVLTCDERKASAYFEVQVSDNIVDGTVYYIADRYAYPWLPGIWHCGIYQKTLSHKHRLYPDGSQDNVPAFYDTDCSPGSCQFESETWDRFRYNVTVPGAHEFWGSYEEGGGYGQCVLYRELVIIPPSTWDGPPCTPCVGNSGAACVHPTPTSLIVSSPPDLTLKSPLGDRTIERTYRTSLVGNATAGDGMFGKGWRANFEYQIGFLEGNATYGVMLSDAQGRKIFYHRDYFASTETYLSPDGNGGSITKNIDDTWTWWDEQGTLYHFHADGKIDSIKDIHDNIETLIYPENQPDHSRIVGLVDRHGRNLSFDYQGTNYVKTLRGPSTPGNPSGEYAGYTHDTAGNLIAVDFPDGTSQVYAYTDTTSPNHMTSYSVSGPEGTVVQQEVDYDDQGRVEAVSEGSGGRSYGLQYGVASTDPTVYVTTVTEQINGQPSERKYYYENQGGAYVVTRIEGVTCGCASEKSFDSEYHLLESTDNRETTSQMSYNDQGDLTTLIEAAGTVDERVTAYDYVYAEIPGAFPGQLAQKITRQPSVVAADGEKVISETYHPTTGKLLMRAVEGLQVDETTPTSSTTSYTYTSAGAVETVDGPNPGSTTYVYHQFGTGAGMLQSIVEANEAQTFFNTYDALGNLLSKVDANNHETTFSYDARGHLQTQTTVDGATRYEYDALGNVTKVTYPKGNSVSYARVPSGVSVIADASGRIEYGYTDGRKTSESIYKVIDESTTLLVKSTTYTYDDEGRLYQAKQPNGDFEEFLYDGNGNRTHVKLCRADDPLCVTPLRITIQGYDLFNRLQSVSVEKDGIIHQQAGYHYDAQGNLFEVTDPLGQLTNYFHDDFGRQGRVDSPETGSTSFVHDAAGNLLSRTDNVNREISYQGYDGLNRPAAITYSDGTASVVFEYDTYTNIFPESLPPPELSEAKGHLTEVTDASGFRRFIYDAAGRLATVVHHIDGRTFTTGYDYDVNGNLASMTYPSGRVVEYVYDPTTDRVRSVTTSKESLFQVLADNITHLPFGPIDDFDYGNGTHVSRVFEDQSYRLSSLAVTNPTVLPERVYTYSPAGNIVNVARAGGQSHDFEYDPLDRLTSWQKPDRWQEFVYDENGNRESFTDSGQVTSYDYVSTALNLLDSSSSAAGAVVYQRDALGNITGWGARDFTYDINGRVQSATLDGVPALYVYNVDGQRIKKTAGQTTYFEFDSGGRLIHEYRPFEGDYIDYVYLAGEPLAMLTDKYMNRFTATPSAGDNGSVTPATPQRVDFNQSVVFTVTPDTDYKIEAVTGCPGSLVGDTYTAGPITGDCTVAASFVIKPGHIIVQEVAIPVSAPSFTFTPSYNAGVTFTMGNGQSNDSGELLPGNYSVTQALPGVWGLGSASCDNGDDPSAIALLPGQTVTCTYANLLTSRVGTFRDRSWYLDMNGTGTWESTFDTLHAAFGLATDIPITGDWDGNGTTEIGVFRNSAWYLDADGNGSWITGVDTKVDAFGLATDVPVTGDWNGDGATEIGVFRNGAWSLDADGSGTWTAGIDIVYAAFGSGSDIPITGDWNDDGRTEIGVFRNGTWYLDNGDGIFSAGPPDAVFAFGLAGDIPVTGDWNGDGVTDVGVFRNGDWHLDTDGSRSWTPNVDRILPIGLSGDKPVTGKW